MSSESYGSWWLDHPVRAIVAVLIPVALGGLAGVAAAWITSSTHLVSPDNAAAGFLMGTGGALAGLLTGLAVAAWFERRYRP